MGKQDVPRSREALPPRDVAGAGVAKMFVAVGVSVTVVDFFRRLGAPSSLRHADLLWRALVTSALVSSRLPQPEQSALLLTSGRGRGGCANQQCHSDTICIVFVVCPVGAGDSVNGFIRTMKR